MVRRSKQRPPPPKKSSPAARAIATGPGGKLMSSAARQTIYTGEHNKTIVSYRVTAELLVEGLVFSGRS